MMKVLAMLCLVTATAGLPAAYIEQHADLLWANFKQTYNKKYTGADESHRRAVFMANMLEAAAKELVDTAEYGMNAFTDLTAEEFKVYHSLNVPKTAGPAKNATLANLKATPVDWRQKGAVTHVKNQAQCGSCWAFSTTGGIEGQWFLAGNTLTSLSEQELVSCDTNDNGCGGGLMDNAFKWLLSKEGGRIVTEEAYPYHSGDGRNGRCESVTGMKVGAKIDGHHDIAHDEDQMASWVSTNGPLSIAVDASRWQTYRGGVMSNCGHGRLDHGVLIVGFTADAWIIKNSWGPSWGENGYIRVQRGTNQCSIKESPCTSIVKSN